MTDVPPKKCIFKVSLENEKKDNSSVPPGYEEAGCNRCGGYLFSCEYYTPFSKAMDLGMDVGKVASKGPGRP